MQQTKLAKKSLRPQSQRLVLEPRIVFDAVLPVMGAEAIEHLAEQSAPEQTPHIDAPAVADENTNQNDKNISSDRALIEGTLAPTNLTSPEIIFIDAIVADLQQYITNHPNADVVLLDANRDGLEQIAATLAGRTGIESVHIISHGTAGAIDLGNTSLNIGGINGQYADELATIKAALSADADILIYGCNVAEGATGQVFASALATATGADIAASTDLTGAAKLGGDWNFETQTGLIDSLNVINAIGQTDFNQLLGPAPISLNFGTPTVLVNAAGGLVGDKWLYSNVTTGVDAVVTISAVTGNPSLGNIDAPSSGGGRDASFQPVITSIPSANERITFTISFVLNGTATVGNPTGTATTLSNFIATGVDVDGQGNATEFASFQLADSAKIEVGSQITQGGTATNPTFTGISSSLAGIDVETTQANYSVFYDRPVSSITFSLGNTGTAGGAFGPRQNSISFNSADIRAYDSPVGVSDSATTNEDAPITFSILDNDWGGEQGTNGGRAQTPLNQASVDLDPTTAGIQTTRTIAGQGTFTYNGNGTVTFAPVANFNGVVTPIQYVVSNTVVAGLNPVAETTNPATIRVTVTAVNDVITVGGLNNGTVSGTDAQVRESDLSTGTTPSGTGEATNGTFTLGPIDSLTSLTLGGGAAITAAQLQASGTTPITRIGSFGTLVINGYNAATGVVSYTYTLASATNHSVGIVNDVFGIATTDVEGDINNSSSLRINILDDAPIAVADTDEAINFPLNPSSTASGNVFTGVGGTDPNNADGNKDTQGADTLANPVTGISAGFGAPVAGNVGNALAGSFGSVTLNANGSYTYTPNLANPTVASLLPGQSVTDTFTYEISDGDGDKVTTTLRVNIVGVPAVVGLGDGAVAGTDGSVLESDLAAGTNEVGTGEILNGSFQLVSPSNPVLQITVGTTVIPIASLNNAGTTPITVAGSTGAGAGRGTLIINGYDATTGVVSYSYTLNTPDNSSGTVIENFAVSLRDSANNVTPPKNLGIAIIDDAPIAGNDTAVATENAGPVAGNVFTNDQIGADGSIGVNNPVTGLVSGTGSVGNANVGTPLAGSFGSITLNADGTYNYTVNNANPAVNALKVGQTLSETYSYKITDKDGDTATATLTITINGANDAPVANDNTYNTTEDGGAITLNPLNGDTDPDGDTLTITDIAGTTITPGVASGPIAVTGGVVNVSSAGVVTFTPNANYNGTTTFAYTISDGTTTSTANQIINVAPINDAPTANPNTKTIAEDAPGGATGNVITENNGAGVDSDPDTGNSTGLTVTQFSIAGVAGSFTAGATATIAAGTVRINADGSYVFTPAANFNGNVPQITYTISDNTGAANQTASSTLDITVTPVDDAPINTVPGTQNTNEDTPVVFSTANGNAIQIADVDGGNQTVTLTMGNGTVSLNGVAGLTFTNGDGTNDGVMTFSGTVAAINAALNGLTFTPTPDYNNTSTIAPQASISLKTGSGSAPVPGFVNGSFEQNIGAGFDPGVTFNLVNENDIPGWDTSATDNTIEIWRSGFAGLPPILAIPAYEGDFIAELNAEQLSTLSNTFTPTAGSALSVEFAHRGRESGTVADVMRFEAIDLGADGVAGGVGANADTVLFSQIYSDTNTAWGVYTADITPNATGNAIQLSFTAISGSGGSATEGNLLDGVVVRQGSTVDSVVNINVTPVKDTVADNLTTPVNTAITFNALTNAPANGAAADNFEGSPVITSITQPLAGAGTVTFTPAGSMTFTPVAGFTGTATYTYTVTSPVGVTETETVTITVINDAPIANPDSVFTPEDTPVSGSITANDTDAPGTTLTVTSFTIAGQAGPFVVGTPFTIAGVGDITINANGTYTFNPALNFTGSVPQINYTINDGSGSANATASSTFNITVGSDNDPPVAVGGSVVANEDVPSVPVNLSGTDIDGTVASLTLTSALPSLAQGILYFADGTTPVPAGATITPAQAASLVFVPAPNFNGTVVIPFVVTDNEGAISTPANFTIQIDAVNDAPVANPDTGTTPEDTPITGNILGNDTDVDSPTLTVTQISIGGIVYVVPAGAAGVTVNLSQGDITVRADGSYNFAPALNFNGAVPTVTYTVNDGSGTPTATATSTLNLTVTPVNDNPIAVTDNYTVPEDGAPITLNPLTSDTDVDGNTLTITNIAGTTITPGVASGPIAVTGGVVNVSAVGVISFTPNLNFNGTVTFPYTISDGNGGTATADQIIAVTPANDPPVATPTTATGNEDTPIPVGLVGTDVEDGIPNIVTVTTLPPPSQGRLFLADGVTPVTANTPLTAAQAAGLVFVPAPNFNGTVTIPFTVTDSNGVTSPPANAVITVTPVNDNPIAVTDNYTVPEDGAPITLNPLTSDTDVDGNTLTITNIAGTTITPGVASGPIAVTGGVVNVSAVGVISFTPNLNFNGTVTFPYTISDGNGGTATADQIITVTPANDPPVATPTTATGNEDTPIPVGLVGTDVEDPAANLITRVTTLPPPTQGVLYLADGVTPVLAGSPLTAAQAAGLIFRPAPNFNGTVTIPFTTTDTNGAVSPSANAIINVTPENDPPVAIGGSTDTPDDTTTAPGAIVLTGSDVDGTIVSVKVTSLPLPAQGVLYFADGITPVLLTDPPMTTAVAATLRFDPNPGYVSTLTDVVQIGFIVTDNLGADSAPGIFTVVVNLANDPPTATSVTPNTPEDTPVIVNLTGTDPDPGDRVGSVSLVSLPPANEGVLYLSDGVTPAAIGVDYPPGSFVFVPASNFTGPVTPFNFTTKDTLGQISSPPGTVSITVSGVNDAPVAAPDVNTVNEDTTATGNILTNDTDVDSPTLTVTQFVVNGSTVNVPAGGNGSIAIPEGTLTIGSNGAYTFAPATNFNGSVPTVTYTVSDGSGTPTATATSTLDITVTPVNDPPVATPATTATPTEDGPPVVVPLVGTDPDGTVATVTITAGPPATQGTLTYDNDGLPGTPPVAVPLNTPLTPAQAATVTFTPAPNYAGPVTPVTFTVTDNLGAVSPPANVTIPTIVNVNEAPVATPATTATPTEDGPPVVVPLVGTDPDGTVATVTITAGPPATQGTLTYDDDGLPGTPPVAVPLNTPLTPAQAATVTFTPAPNYAGPVTPVTFTVTDNLGAVSPPANVTIPTIVDVNEAPVATPATTATPTEDGPPVAVPLVGTDPDGTVATVTITAGPPATQGTLTYDNDGLPGTPPVAVPLNTPLTPAQAATVTFTPAPNYAGPVTPVTFTVTDNLGAVSPPANVTIPTIVDVNDPPVAANDTAVVISGSTTPLNLLGNDTDPDGDTLTIKSINGIDITPGTPQSIPVPNGVVNVSATGVVTFTSAPGYNGPASFDYVVQDGNGGEDTGTVNISVVADSGVLFEQLLSQPNGINNLDPNRPDPFAIRSPVIPIGMPEDIFVIHSVRESAMRIAQNSNFGVFNVDAPTRGELDNLTFDLKGLPVGMDPTLFVQHAVRSLPITQEPRLFVQNAVRQSQLESTMRNIGVTSYNTATSGVSSLFSPFDLGSPNDAVDLSIDGVNGEFSDKTSEMQTKPATKLALDVNHESIIDIGKLEAPAIKDADINNTTSKEMNVKLLQANLPLETKKMAAASFANQLTAAAKKLKSNDFFNLNK